MIFYLRQKKVNVNVSLILENTAIKQVMEAKFLGVLIDQHLSWKPHIDFVSKIISKSVGILAKAGFYLSSQTLITFFNILKCCLVLHLLFQPELYLPFVKVYGAAHNKSSLSSKYCPFI